MAMEAMLNQPETSLLELTENMNVCMYVCMYVKNDKIIVSVMNVVLMS